MSDIIRDLVSALMCTVITVVLPIVLRYFCDWYETQKEIKLNELKNKELKSALEELTSVAESTVKSIYQTYVEELKKSGKFDKENQEIALKKAKNIAMISLSNGSREILQSSYNYLDKVLENIIESLIADSKV